MKGAEPVGRMVFWATRYGVERTETLLSQPDNSCHDGAYCAPISLPGGNAAALAVYPSATMRFCNSRLVV